MALQTFKEVIQNKGYRISTQDREVFEQGNLQSFFGLSDYDVIELVVYDVNDNQLTQANNGLVRYIPLTNQNIKDYILIPQGTLFQKYKFPKEYFIDAERLLKEAGYTNGIFKIQVTLINKRAGSGEEVNNKLWISEISPSRTEIRLYPLKKGLEEHKQLQERFNIFVNDKNFREDTIINAVPFVEMTKADYVKELITNKYTSKWFDKLRAEFKIANFDEFATKVRNAFIQSCQYEFTNRYSKIGELNYGQPRSTTSPLSLSVDDIAKTTKLILIQTINHYLIKQNVRETSTFDSGIRASFDDITNILQRNENDTIIDTSYPILRQVTLLKPKQSELSVAVEKEDPSAVKPPPVLVPTNRFDNTGVTTKPYEPGVLPTTGTRLPGGVFAPGQGAIPNTGPTSVVDNGSQKPTYTFESSPFGFSPGVPIGPPVEPLEETLPTGTSNQESPLKFYYELVNETNGDEKVTYNVGPNAQLLTIVVPAGKTRMVCANVGTVYGNVTKTSLAGCG